MSSPVSVKVSRRHQISVPRIARERLNIQSGDRLLVDIQDGLLILIPQPENYTARLAGMHREVWTGVDATAYLQEEREAWDNSASE
jgi:AbrB family looped-hinge helix DNA binding protein